MINILSKMLKLQLIKKLPNINNWKIEGECRKVIYFFGKRRKKRLVFNKKTKKII